MEPARDAVKTIASLEDAGLACLLAMRDRLLAGGYTDVKAERDDKWVYLLDDASVPLPLPPE